MSLINKVREEMQKAMKENQKERKAALSSLLNALQNKEKDKKGELSEAEECVVVRHEIKQTTETLESAPAVRTDIIHECNFRISVLKEFLPPDLTEQQIRQIIEIALLKLKITNPTKKDKGSIMKEVTPRTKGRADGKVVNKLVDEYIS